jgi:hypothetical protein
LLVEGSSLVGDEGMLFAFLFVMGGHL